MPSKSNPIALLLLLLLLQCSSVAVAAIHRQEDNVNHDHRIDSAELSPLNGEAAAATIVIPELQLQRHLNGTGK